MLVTIEGLAKAIPGLTRNAIYSKARSGEIPHIRVGSKRLFDVDQVQKWLLDSAMANVKQQEENEKHDSNYGKLRTIQGRR